MSARADLHNHTTASDGRLTPRQLVFLAKEAGLAAVGITDHDTVAGLPEALDAGQEAGVRVVPGVELSAEHNGHEVHVLGYYLDAGQLAERFARLRAQRTQRMERMVAQLQAIGIDVSMDDVYQEARQDGADAPALGRPHLARALVTRGVVQSTAEAFERYLTEGKPGYVARRRLTAVEALRIIREAHGVPVLAHPGLAPDADQLVQALVGEGLVGIEAYHCSHNQAQSEHFRLLGEQLGLLVTGGSDFHAPGERMPLGSCTVDVRVADALLERAGRM